MLLNTFLWSAYRLRLLLSPRLCVQRVTSTYSPMRNWPLWGPFSDDEKKNGLVGLLKVTIITETIIIIVTASNCQCQCRAMHFADII